MRGAVARSTGYLGRHYTRSKFLLFFVSMFLCKFLQFNCHTQIVFRFDSFFIDFYNRFVG